MPYLLVICKIKSQNEPWEVFLQYSRYCVFKLRQSLLFSVPVSWGFTIHHNYVAKAMHCAVKPSRTQYGQCHKSLQYQHVISEGTVVVPRVLNKHYEYQQCHKSSQYQHVTVYLQQYSFIYSLCLYPTRELNMPLMKGSMYYSTLPYRAT